jgi:two-component system chemotaxis response regulator CheB
MAKKDIVTIGGSAGSGSVLRDVLNGLPGDFPASVFITTHVPTQSPGYLAESLDRASPLPVAAAVDGQPVEAGRVYIAPADRHLLLVDGTILLGDGPRENMVRPSIDPMMRSAAFSYGPRAVGVILTGMLNDGASGLAAIKQMGGTAVVQHPLDAREDSMPLAALEAVEPDHVVLAEQLPSLLQLLVQEEAGVAPPPPDSLAFEVEIASGRRVGADALARHADASVLTCPDCGGVLSEVRGEQPLRFRCQIGHAVSAEVLAAATGGVDEAIRVAMRVMEERVSLVERMAQDARQAGRKAVAELYEARTQEYRRYAETLRDAAMLTSRMRTRGGLQDA